MCERIAAHLVIELGQALTIVMHERHWRRHLVGLQRRGCWFADVVYSQLVYSLGHDQHLLADITEEFGSKVRLKVIEYTCTGCQWIEESALESIATVV